MIKTLKRLTLTLAISVAVICACAFAAACNKEDDAPTGDSYVITVLYPDGKAVNGLTDGTGGVKPGSDGEAGTFVQVQFCDADNESVCYRKLNLGADGKLSIDANELENAISVATNFAVHLTGLPKGYTYDNNYTVSKTSKTLTINLKNV